MGPPCCAHVRSIAKLRWGVVGLLLTIAAGCGVTKSNTATEQLLTSDAVDMAIAQIDFRPLAGQLVYFDVKYLQNHKGVGFTNAEYITSSLRQQMIGAGCLLQDDKESAEFVVEARIGALGSDSHDIVYGIPASNALSTAASVVTGTPAIPTIPEISFARKNDQSAAAKLGVFAYHRESKQRVWQSGMSVAKSTAKDLWFLGAGPFQSGTVYDGVQFAGSDLLLKGDPADLQTPRLSHYREPALFNPPALPLPQRIVAEVDEADDDGVVVSASAEAEAPDEDAGSGD
jgi:hypothetical protein